MYQYRQILVRMRQGDSDRDIARAKTMGRKKVAQLREIARERDWLAPDSPIPDEQTLAAALGRKETVPSSCLSTLEPWGGWPRATCASQPMASCRHSGHHHSCHADA